MSEYLVRGKELLKELSKQGCEAYIIGEASRCEITQTEPTDIEIVTSCTPSKIREIFPNYNIVDIKPSSCLLTVGNFEYTISTFRKSLMGKTSQRNLKNVYSKNLKEELSFRIMTTESIAMTSSGKFSDAYGGAKDIRQRRINPIGNTKAKIKEAPELIFKVAKVYGQTNYHLSSKLYASCKKNRKEIANLSILDFYRDLRFSLECPKYKKILRFYEQLNPKKYFPVVGREIARLCKENKKEDFDTILANSMILNGAIDEVGSGLFSNYDLYTKAINLALTNPKSQFDNITMYANGLDAILLSNKLLFGLRKDKNKQKKIKKAFDKLPIKAPCDLEFKGQDLIEVLNRNDYVITQTIEEVIRAVLLGELQNDHDVLMSYARSYANDLINPRVETIESEDVKETQDDIQLESYEELKEQQKEEVYDENPYALGGSIYSRKFPSEDASSQNYYNQDYSKNSYQDNYNQAFMNGYNSGFNTGFSNNNRIRDEYDEANRQVRADFNSYKYAQIERELEEMKRQLKERDMQMVSLQKSQLIQKLTTEVNSLVNHNVQALEEAGVFKSMEDKNLYIIQQRSMYVEMLLRKSEYQILTKEDLLNEKN